MNLNGRLARIEQALAPAPIDPAEELAATIGRVRLTLGSAAYAVLFGYSRRDPATGELYRCHDVPAPPTSDGLGFYPDLWAFYSSLPATPGWSPEPPMWGAGSGPVALDEARVMICVEYHMRTAFVGGIVTPDIPVGLPEYKLLIESPEYRAALAARSGLD